MLPIRPMSAFFWQAERWHHTQMNCFRGFSQILLQLGLSPQALTEVWTACLGMRCPHRRTVKHSVGARESSILPLWCRLWRTKVYCHDEIWKLTYCSVVSVDFDRDFQQEATLPFGRSASDWLHLVEIWALAIIKENPVRLSPLSKVNGQ